MAFRSVHVLFSGQAVSPKIAKGFSAENVSSSTSSRAALFSTTRDLSPPPFELADEKASIVALRYFSREELDSPPRAINAPDLETISGDWPGRLELTLLLSPTGGVDFVLVQENLAATQVEQIQAAFKVLRFEPGKIGGLPVKSRVSVEVFSEDILQPVLAPSAPVSFEGPLTSP